MRTKMLLFLCLVFVALIATNGVAVDTEYTMLVDGDGDYSDWGRLRICSADYMCVDDPSWPYDGDTTYVSSITDGAKELFTVENPPVNLGWIVTNVSIVITAKQFDSDSFKFRFLMKTNGEEWALPIVTSTSSWENYVFDYSDANPVTGNPWTVNELDNLQIGMMLNTVNPGAKVTSFIMSVRGHYS